MMIYKLKVLIESVFSSFYFMYVCISVCSSVYIVHIRLDNVFISGIISFLIGSLYLGMVVILDILHTFHLGFFDDNHIPITTNSCLLL